MTDSEQKLFPSIFTTAIFLQSSVKSFLKRFLHDDRKKTIDRQCKIKAKQVRFYFALSSIYTTFAVRHIECAVSPCSLC